MQLRFPESAIPEWAAKYVASQDMVEENALIAECDRVQETGYLDKPQLRKVARWKAPRSAGYMDRNEDGYIVEISRMAFAATEERSRIELLTLLDGVLWPTASVILHLCHREPYPILDFRALWSVGLDVPNQYTFAFWSKYVSFCREIQERTRFDMRTIDRALWQYSKDNQPRQMSTP